MLSISLQVMLFQVFEGLELVEDLLRPSVEVSGCACCGGCGVIVFYEFLQFLRSRMLCSLVGWGSYLNCIE